MSSHRHQEERGSSGGCGWAGVSPADMVVELYVLRRATCAWGRQAGAEGDLRQESCRIGFLTTSCKKRSPLSLSHLIPSHPQCHFQPSGRRHKALSLSNCGGIGDAYSNLFLSFSLSLALSPSGNGRATLNRCAKSDP